MSDERQKESIEETVKNAASGYATVVLAVVSFVVLLALLATVVRFIAGPGIGA